MSSEAIQEQQKSWTQTPPATPPLRHAIAQVAEKQMWLDRLAQPFQCFHLRDGSVVNGPAVYAQPTFAVRVRNSTIELRRIDHA